MPIRANLNRCSRASPRAFFNLTKALAHSYYERRVFGAQGLTMRDEEQFDSLPSPNPASTILFLATYYANVH